MLGFLKTKKAMLDCICEYFIDLITIRKLHLRAKYKHRKA